jgi:hypothetical protein
MWIVNWARFVVIEYAEQLFEVQKCLLSCSKISWTACDLIHVSIKKFSFCSKFNLLLAILNLFVTWTSVDPVSEVVSAGGNRMGLYTDRLSKLIKRMNNFYKVKVYIIES